MSDFQKRKGDYSHISEVLSGIVKSIRKDSATDLIRIREEWYRFVDPAISDHARPEALKHDILLVRVASSTLTHRLRFMAPGIIDAINQSLGENRIAEIRFKIGNI
jgi:predicted nucleic acid-binding Zn ribbon protein